MQVQFSSLWPELLLGFTTATPTSLDTCATASQVGGDHLELYRLHSPSEMQLYQRIIPSDHWPGSARNVYLHIDSFHFVNVASGSSYLLVSVNHLMVQVYRHAGYGRYQYEHSIAASARTIWPFLTRDSQGTHLRLALGGSPFSRVLTAKIRGQEPSFSHFSSNVHLPRSLPSNDGGSLWPGSDGLAANQTLSVVE